MFRLIGRFQNGVRARLPRGSRWILVLLVLPLLLSFFVPLWRIELHAPQYPEGLELEIFAYTVEGDIEEVNTLNHYIGMARIDRAALSDLDWIPFALGALVLLTLRVAAFADGRALMDLVAIFVYFSAFSMGRFAYKLWVFGHNLDPKAPFDVEPFMPPLLGGQEIANFTAASWPGGASALVALYALGLLGIAAWQLLRTRPGPPARAPGGAGP